MLKALIVPRIASGVLDLILTLQNIHRSKGEWYSGWNLQIIFSLHLHLGNEPTTVCFHVGMIPLCIYCIHRVF